MSPTVADISEDAHSSKSPPVPTGWTAGFTDNNNAETMLNYSTGLTASLELTEDEGSRYIFFIGQELLPLEHDERGWMADSQCKGSR
ncbi:hypothetical protein BDR07DRAFT_1607367 [Suillus spraguei]|nr:hypothetical protein BDR07DRAFT_1607367 [Suillus spraguei]